MYKLIRCHMLRLCQLPELKMLGEFCLFIQFYDYELQN